MKAIKHDKAVALLACGFMFAATAGLVVSGLNKSEEIAQTAGVESFEKVDSKEMNNVLSLERMDNILVGATLEDFYGASGMAGKETLEETTEEETTETETASEEQTTETETETQQETEAATAPEETTEAEEPYAYADFFMVNVSDYLNVRAEPSEDAEVVGKIYAGGGGQVLAKGGEWSGIQSGNVTGYIKNDYAWFAQDAEANIANVCPLIATSNVESLRLRKGPGLDYGIEDVMEQGVCMTVMADYGEWLLVSYAGVTGYTAKEFVSMQYDIGTGITTAEEQAQLAAEQARIAEEAAAQAEKQAQEEAEAKKEQAETVYTSAYQLGVEDSYLLASLVMAEAGGECYEGKLAVANIVLNRLNSGKYGSSISDVIYASGQFSVVRNGALDKAIANGPNSGSVQAAEEALSGVNNVPDYTSFCTLAVAKYSRYSAYSVIGNQVFYR